VSSTSWKDTQVEIAQRNIHIERERERGTGSLYGCVGSVVTAAHRAVTRCSLLSSRLCIHYLKNYLGEGAAERAVGAVEGASLVAVELRERKGQHGC
jgi:hypothetical protein